MADIRKSTLARVLFSMDPCPIAEKSHVELQALWSDGRSVELVRDAGVGPGRGPGTGLLRFLLSQRKLPK